MCEINPKHAAVFTVEVFTSQQVTNDVWLVMYRGVIEQLLRLEERLNESGRIRVHVHEVTQDTK